MGLFNHGNIGYIIRYFAYSYPHFYFLTVIFVLGIFGYLSKVNMPNDLSDFNYFSIIADKNNGVFGKLKVFGNAVSGIFAVSLLLTFPVDFLGIHI